MLTRKFGGALLLSLALMAAPGSALAQDNDLGSLYGSQNLQYAIARFMPMMTPYEGMGGEFMFGFNTSSRKTEGRTTWKRFGGVSLGGGGFVMPDADMGKYETRDVTAGYVLLQLESRVFQTVEGPVRPYYAASVGIGTGSIWMETGADLPDPPINGLQMFVVGAEAGVQFKVGNQDAVTVGIAADARALTYGTDARFVVPVMLTVGWCRWLGPM